MGLSQMRFAQLFALRVPRTEKSGNRESRSFKGLGHLSRVAIRSPCARELIKGGEAPEKKMLY